MYILSMDQEGEKQNLLPPRYSSPPLKPKPRGLQEFADTFLLLLNYEHLPIA
jgi:hypothetical protein